MDSESFKRAVMPFVDSMYRIALCITGNEADAADAVQDTCMKLWEHRDKLDNISNIRAYAHGAVRNTCLDAIGKRSPAKDIEEARDISSDSNIEREYEAAESFQNVQRLISGLPANQRAVITMRDIEGLTLEEIEKATGYTNANIRVLLCRARTTVRKLFQP